VYFVEERERYLITKEKIVDDRMARLLQHIVNCVIEY